MFREEKQIKKLEKDAALSREIGAMGVVAGVGALAVALYNVCTKDYDLAAICAVSGAFSTLVGAMNLNNARKTFARAKEVYNKQFEEPWRHGYEY